LHFLDSVLSLILKWKCCFNFWQTPQKHWNDSVGWEIGKVMHCIVVIETKVGIHLTRHLATSCNEVKRINNQGWVSPYLFYLMEGLKHMPILLNLERSCDDGTINNLTNMIQNSLLVYGGLTMEEISNKLVFLVLMVSMCLSVFIIGVTTQIWKRELLSCLLSNVLCIGQT
jgi:hypothetical protein